MPGHGAGPRTQFSLDGCEKVDLAGRSINDVGGPQFPLGCHGETVPAIGSDPHHDKPRVSHRGIRRQMARGSKRMTKNTGRSAAGIHTSVLPACRALTTASAT